jgi:hypothetical protein
MKHRQDFDRSEMGREKGLGRIGRKRDIRKEILDNVRRLEHGTVVRYSISQLNCAFAICDSVFCGL